MRNYYLDLFIRLALCFTPISLFYFILTPITIYSIYFALSPLLPNLTNNIIEISGKNFELVKACIAAYAYYFLLLLVLLTKDIKLKLRLKLLLFGSLLIFIMNIARVVLLILISVYLGSEWFDLIHLFFWRFVSGVYVALVWILLVRIYKIKSIPIWSDLMYLYDKSIFKK